MLCSADIPGRPVLLSREIEEWIRGEGSGGGAEESGRRGNCAQEVTYKRRMAKFLKSLSI